MSLSKVLEEIKRVKPYAEEDVDSGPVETMTGRRGRKNQAIESLKLFRRKYRTTLTETAAFIIVTGDKREAFSTSAVENFKCFSANPDAFYEDLANRLPSSLYQGSTESVANMFDILGRHLEDKARELDIVGYPQMIFKQQYRVTIKSKDDLVSLVRQAINDQVGSEVVGLQAVASLVDTAISKDHGGTVTPIVLTTGSEKLALDLESSLRRLHSRGVFLVVAGKGTKALRATPNVITIKDPTNENVEQALTTISGTVKGK